MKQKIIMQLIQKLTKYKLNGAAALLVIIITSNTVIVLFNSNVFTAIVQLSVLMIVIVLGNRAQIWKDNESNG